MGGLESLVPLHYRCGRGARVRQNFRLTFSALSAIFGASNQYVSNYAPARKVAGFLLSATATRERPRTDRSGVAYVAS